MDTRGSQPDPGTSEASSRNSSQTTVTSSTFHNLRTKPTCARCRNHHILIPVKGHKGSCHFRNCNCVKCHVVAEGGRLRAMQLAIWRAVEKERKAREGEKNKSRETDRDTTSKNEMDTSRETTTPSVPGIDSQMSIESAVLPSLHDYCNVQKLSTSKTAKETCNIIPAPELEHQLPLPYHQDIEKYRSPNTVVTTVDPGTHSLAMVERTHTLSSPGSNSSGTQTVVPSDWNNKFCSTFPPQEPKYGPLESGSTQLTVPTGWMAKHSDTIPGLQRNIQLTIPFSDSFSGSGALTTPTPFVTDIFSLKDRFNLLSSSGSTGGCSLPIEPPNNINIARSTIQQPQRCLQSSNSSSHNFTYYAPQIHAALTRTDFRSTTDGSGSFFPDSTRNATVPNLSSVCMNNAGCTIPQPNPKSQYSHLCGHTFTRYDPLNIAEIPGTDFRSIDSLSSPFPSNCTRTPQITSSACVNVARRIPQRQPVPRTSQWSCGSLPRYGTDGTSYYDTLIRQYDLNSRYLNGS